MNKVLKITIAVVLCLIVILAVVLLVTQCSNKNETPEENPTVSTTKPTTTPTTPTTPPECTEHTDANTDYICDVCGKDIERPVVDPIVTTNDKVYVITTELNLRKTPNETGVATVSAKMDDELSRIGYYTEGKNEGWSKILHNGEEYYVWTESVTTQKPIVIVDGDPETVYLTKNEIVYSKPSKILSEQYSEEMDTLFAGQSVERLGVATDVYADGEITFAKIKYVNSQGTEVVWYIDNAALTTEAPNPDGSVTFDNCNVTLVLKVGTLWLRKSTIYAESEKELEITKGTVLQTIGYGVESDQTHWYKVVYNGEVYYAIYKSATKGPYFDIITLPEGFAVVEVDDSNYSISNGTVSCSIARTPALPTGTTTLDVANSMIETMQLRDVYAQEKDGITYFEFIITSTAAGETVTAYCLVVITAEGNNNRFHATTLAAEGIKADVADILWGYADTIQFIPAE